MRAIELRDNNFNKAFSLALLAHLLLITIGVLLTQIQTKKHKAENSQEIYIKSAVRVDIVAMPTLTQKEIKELPMLDTGAPEPLEAPAEKAQPVKKVDLSNLLKDFSKKTKAPKAKDSKSKDEAIDQKQMARLRGLVLEGNKVSKGTTKLGDSKEINLSEYNTYVGSLPSFVRPHWKLPTYLRQEGLKCRVRIFISKTGKILNKEIYQSSGNNDFDQRALRAIDATKTFPKPPEGIQSRLLSGSATLGFPL